MTFVIKEVDNIWSTVHRVDETRATFLYPVKLNEVDIEEVLTEDEFDRCIFTSDEWIVMKDFDVFVKVGTTNYPAKIDSMDRLSKELVDTKSLKVRWTSNNKKDVVDIASVQSMYFSEEDTQRRARKHSITNEQHPHSIASTHTKIQ